MSNEAGKRYGGGCYNPPVLGLGKVTLGSFHQPCWSSKPGGTGEGTGKNPAIMPRDQGKLRTGLALTLDLQQLLARSLAHSTDIHKQLEGRSYVRRAKAALLCTGILYTDHIGDLDGAFDPFPVSSLLLSECPLLFPSVVR